MSTTSYIIIGTILVAGMVYVKTEQRKFAPGPTPAVAQEPGRTLPDEGQGWQCFRSNAVGSGTVPCILIKEPNRVTFSFEDSAQITFHTQDQEGSTAEVSGVQVEGANREPAFGFCEFRGNGARCEASNGAMMIEYDAR